ncbi:SMP-30/gluconolactonase/LRE family protein, partial [Rhodococcus qingshengii]|uniref:SMP-30/gluconolactonase/LRE family protein n=1 Tax=Rhodococcus qingshengii TaxID=334542 RepID=UPI00287F935C
DGAVYVCNNGGFEWAKRAGFLIPGHKPKDYSGGRIERVNLSTGKFEVLYSECDGHPLRGPNDLVFDAEGGFWFTDHAKST